MEALGLQEDEATIRDDVQGLIHIGLNIAAGERECVWKDEINDLILPVPKKLAKSSQSETKEKLREKLRNLPHEYLSLVDLAYDSKQNRLFEMKVIELLTEECGFQGLHLGGSRRPDGVLYTAGLTDNYGIILTQRPTPQATACPLPRRMKWSGMSGKTRLGMNWSTRTSGGRILKMGWAPFISCSLPVILTGTSKPSWKESAEIPAF